jgi:thymidine kinase
MSLNYDNPEFIIYTGPMFSSKTSKLLLTLEKFKHQNKKIIAFKPAIDDRYSENQIVTHMGWKYDSRIVKDHLDMLRILSEDPEDFNVVAVDEQFMIKGSADVLIWLFQKGFTIVVSTLDLSYSGTPFDEVSRIMPYATRIEKCTSVCTVCGKDAHYTHRIVQTDDEISVGGAESYEPRCFHHFIALNKGDI